MRYKGPSLALWLFREIAGGFTEVPRNGWFIPSFGEETDVSG